MAFVQYFMHYFNFFTYIMNDNWIAFFVSRFIVMRRIFLILAVLYLMRSITMYVTVLPMSSTTYYCSPKSNTTASALVIAKRVFQLMSGFGLSINGKHTYCGDFIYSGHTVMLVLGYLIIAECKLKLFKKVCVKLKFKFYFRLAKTLLHFTLDLLAIDVCRYNFCFVSTWSLHDWCTYCILCDN